MYKNLLFDIDGTMLNFLKAEIKSLDHLCAEQNVKLTDELLKKYQEINVNYWKKIENNEIDKDYALIQRFKDTFLLIGRDDIDCVKFNDDYQISLGNNFYPEEGAYALLNQIKDTHELFVVTNGTKIAQENKISNSHLDQYFKEVFISEVIGHEKPSIEFFNAVKEAIHYNNDETIIIGDSLSSDIKGGQNAHIHTVWYNPNHLENKTDIQPEYEIHHLLDLIDIVK